MFGIFRKWCAIPLLATLTTFAPSTLAQNQPNQRLEIDRVVDEFRPAIIYDIRDDLSCRRMPNFGRDQFAECKFPKRWLIKSPTVTATDNARIHGMPFVLNLAYQFVCYSDTEMRVDLDIARNETLALYPRNDVKTIKLPKLMTNYQSEDFEIEMDTEPNHTITYGCYLGLSQFIKSPDNSALRSYARELIQRRSALVKLIRHLQQMGERTEGTVDLIQSMLETFATMIHDRRNDIDILGGDPATHPEIMALEARYTNLSQKMKALIHKEPRTASQTSLFADLTATADQELKLTNAEAVSLTKFIKAELRRLIRNFAPIPMPLDIVNTLHEAGFTDL